MLPVVPNGVTLALPLSALANEIRPRKSFDGSVVSSVATAAAGFLSSLSCCFRTLGGGGGTLKSVENACGNDDRFAAYVFGGGAFGNGGGGKR